MILSHMEIGNPKDNIVRFFFLFNNHCKATIKNDLQWNLCLQLQLSIWNTDFVVVETIALICAQDLLKKVIWVFKLSKDKIEAKIQQIDISRNSRYQYWYAYIHTYIETSPNRLFGWNNNFIFPTDVIVKVRNACDYGISVRFRLCSVDLPSFFLV